MSEVNRMVKKGEKIYTASANWIKNTYYVRDQMRMDRLVHNDSNKTVMVQMRHFLMNFGFSLGIPLVMAKFCINNLKAAKLWWCNDIGEDFLTLLVCSTN